MSASSERARRVLRRAWIAPDAGRVGDGTFTAFKKARGWQPRVQRWWDPERGKTPPHILAQGGKS